MMQTMKKVPRKQSKWQSRDLFDGHNKSAVTYSQELYENTAITDIHTAAKLYGYTEDTAIYGDATFL